MFLQVYLILRSEYSIGLRFASMVQLWLVYPQVGSLFWETEESVQSCVSDFYSDEMYGLTYARWYHLLESKETVCQSFGQKVGTVGIALDIHSHQNYKTQPSVRQESESWPSCMNFGLNAQQHWGYKYYKQERVVVTFLAETISISFCLPLFSIVNQSNIDSAITVETVQYE